MKVPISGQVVGEKEAKYVAQSIREPRLSGGSWNKLFRKQLGEFVGSRWVSLTNSGSSSNLLALSALTSPRVEEEYRLVPGDRVITVASGFPTTVAPIYQLGLVPIFVDVQLGTYNIMISRLNRTLQYKPKAIMIAHTLGNPFNLDAVLDFCLENKVILIEDCCDALGAEWGGQSVGTFGAYSTYSFYPAHHITTGEGGAVISHSAKLQKILNSFRDWGRDCWCEPGDENTCGKRFDQNFEHLPKGYDHKYIYSHLGYNMKMSNMQAACGAAQMEQVQEWREIRRRNFSMLMKAMVPYSEFFILPEIYMKAKLNPFGFPLTIRESAPFSRKTFVTYLEENGIATRPLFGGNLLRQPAFANQEMFMVDALHNSEQVVKNSFWIGCWHGLSVNQINYVINIFNDFLRKIV
jgi:CDP-6-deoxy-D-xylo-4-hexulose-3-dehydrase